MQTSYLPLQRLETTGSVSSLYVPLWHCDICFAIDLPVIPVVTQGRTLHEVTRNLREAVELHLEG